MGMKLRECVYKFNPGLYQRVFSGSGLAWSASCGKYGPYYITHRFKDGTPCSNCGRPRKLEPGNYNIDKDWDERRTRNSV